MIRIWKFINRPRVMLAHAGLWLVVDLILTGCIAELSKSDWATWVGSIGTVGALIGTIWIASTQARSNAKAEQARARLHAASMVVRILHARSDLRRVLTALRSINPSDTYTRAFSVCDGILNSINLWTVEDLMPLLPLPGGIAGLLAHSIGNIEGLRRVLSVAIRCGELTTPEGRADFIHGFSAQIERNLKFLDDGFKGCEDASLLLLLEW